MKIQEIDLKDRTKKYKVSYYIIKTPLFNKNRNILYFSSRTASIVLLNINIHQAITNNQWDMIDDKTFQLLILKKIIVPANENELNEIVKQIKLNSKNRNILAFTVQPSANCQLACSYCGQTHKNFNLPKYYNKEIVERFENKLKSNQYSYVNVGWFGAEPLIGLNQIIELSKRFIQISNESGIKYYATLVTNGVLLNIRTFQKLLDAKVENIELTIDGTEYYHNKTRFFKTGKESFKLIFDNLLKVVEYINNKNIDNVKITVRHNVNKFNQESIFAFMKMMKKHELEKNILYYIMPVHSWGNDAHLFSLSNQEFANLEIDVLSKMEEYNFVTFWLPEKAKSTTCLATRQNDEVIDAYGNIHQCSETPYVSSYPYKLSTLTENLNTYSSIFDKTFSSWYDILLQNKYPCTSCNILPICLGFCPKLWQENITACPSIKFNIVERILKNYIHSL